VLSFFQDYRIIWDTLDIAIVAYVLYRLFLLIRGTRAIQLVKGLMVLFAAGVVARWLELTTVVYILGYAQMALIVAVPVVFQPELRRALEQLGRGKLFAPTLSLPETEMDEVMDEVVAACDVLGRNKIGAIIVLERETGLKDIAETGTAVEGLVSAPFLINIFVPNAPLHDGAAIIRGNRVAAAGCFLPLPEAPDLDRELGTRHRAAMGMSEQSDAVVIVVSEETGSISLANGGRLIRQLDRTTLREMLDGLMKTESSQTGGFRPLGLNLFGQGAGKRARKGGRGVGPAA